MNLKKFPVAWLTIALTVLTSADAVAIWTKLLTPAQATWAGLALAVFTAVAGKKAHDNVTPTVDPRNDAGVRLVPKTDPSVQRSLG